MNNISIIDRKKCYSCRSCEYSCPQKCISFSEDIEGFFYPEVDEKKCINCGCCLLKCPSYDAYTLAKYEKKYYGLKSKDIELLKNSASGGIFAEIAKYTLARQGYVFGAAYDESFRVKQTLCDNFDSLKRLQGSKYVYCDTGTSYEQIKKLVETTKEVLFGGSPCQVAGLKKYLGKDYPNLITIDIICHGTPSQKLFLKYLEWLEKKHNGRILEYSFRDKRIGGWSCQGKAKTDSKEIIIDGRIDPYYSSFLSGKTYKYACYQCQYSNIQARPGDITIGDFWAVSYYQPEFYSQNGVSSCIINTEKGEHIFELIKNNFDVCEIDEKQVSAKNGNIIHPTKEPATRMKIYEGIDTLSLNQYMQKLQLPKVLLIRNYLKKLIPKSFVNYLKTIIGGTNI